MVPLAALSILTSLAVLAAGGHPALQITFVVTHSVITVILLIWLRRTER